MLLCPVFLLHGRLVADVLMVAAGLCFLLRCAAARDWCWLRRGWVPFALAWWLWLLACSVQGGMGEALAAGRFLVFVAALEHWVLRLPWRRLWLARLAALAAAYIAFQTALQLASGATCRATAGGAMAS